MASFRKRGTKWYAEICLKGVRASASFPTKGHAQAWATHTENEILTGKRTAVSDKTVSDLFEEYGRKISPTKAGKKWEQVRLKLFQRDVISDVKLSEIDQTHIAQWRDRRLLTVSGSTVRREWNLMYSAFRVAINEWKWINKHPMLGVTKPESAPPRDRLISEDEIKSIQFALGYVGGIPETKSQRVALAFEFACETAMRAQEICNLKLSDISGSTAAIRKSKTRAGVRNAPLTKRAVEILNILPDENLFDTTPQSLDALFRRAKQRLGITDMTFHDSRHEGITRLARKLTVLELARSIGHQDLRQLLVYFNPTAQYLADRLNDV